MIDLNQVGGMTEGVRSKRTLGKEMPMYGLTVLTQGATAIRSGAVKVVFIEAMTIANLPLQTGLAVATGFV
jgi:hypothetical protein